MLMAKRAKRANGLAAASPGPSGATTPTDSRPPRPDDILVAESGGSFSGSVGETFLAWAEDPRGGTSASSIPKSMLFGSAPPGGVQVHRSPSALFVVDEDKRLSETINALHAGQQQPLPPTPTSSYNSLVGALKASSVGADGVRRTSEVRQNRRISFNDHDATPPGSMRTGPSERTEDSEASFSTPRHAPSLCECRF